MRKQLHYVTLCFLIFNITTLSAEDYVDLYINTYKDIAIREMTRSGIPASITLAQGIHESSWGRGELAVNSNNHFGIKCKDYWQGPFYYYKDDDYDANGNLMKSCFRAYENPEKSYIDHTEFLMNTAHYQVLFNYSNTDYIRWAKGLKKCGYATDKQYADKLIRTIEKYQLHRFDYPQKQVILVSAPKYKIPEKNISNLLIPTEDKKEERYTIVNIPPAIRIPENYQRIPTVPEKIVNINRENQNILKEESTIIEEQKPVRKESLEIKKETGHSNLNEPKPFNPGPISTKTKQESIIPAAFASTKRAYQLTRKPRSMHSNLR